MSDVSRAQLLRDLARRYQAGATLEALAPLFGCSASTLATRLRKIGVTIRPPGGRGCGERLLRCAWDAPGVAGGVALSDPHDDSPDWRARAEQMREWAGRTNDPETRRIMLRIAAGYDKLADNRARTAEEAAEALRRARGGAADAGPAGAAQSGAAGEVGAD